MMERLVRARGVNIDASRNPTRADGYPGIAEALAELAEPAEMDALQFEVWLESTGALMKAAEVVASARGSDIRVPDLMRRLWREILIAVPIATVSAGPSPGTLRVPDNALRRNPPVTVLERRVRHGRATLREVVVSVRGKDTAPGWSIVADPTDRLEPGTAVHDTNYPDVWLHQIYRNVNAFEDHLTEAPKRLADVRTLLYWTAAMLDAPLCQGDIKKRAAEALQQARTFYEAARRQLIEGQTVDAARRIHEALRHISAAAAELARSCGDGQTTLPGAAPALEVTPADRAALAGASATMSLDTERAVSSPSHPLTPAVASASLHGGDIRPAVRSTPRLRVASGGHHDADIVEALRAAGIDMPADHQSRAGRVGEVHLPDPRQLIAAKTALDHAGIRSVVRGSRIHYMRKADRTGGVP